ncbi:MAG TPA: thioesterase domain-containing protein, partial [Blastocatellia bacterium]
EYMAPESFVELDELPLTPNGKVDRRALPALEPTAPKSSYAAPRTPAEEILVGIWQEVLGKTQIGVTEDFFEIGGHSLLVTQVISRIKARLDVEIRLIDFFVGPTISQLAVRVDAARIWGIEFQSPELPARSRPDVSLARGARLVNLNGGGTDAPIFFVHGGDGGVMKFIQLSRALKSESPFFAIQALDEDDPESAIEEVAASYIDVILREQNHGPFRLGGWSFGTAVAFEMAQQLVARDEVIQLLALVDGVAPIVETRHIFDNGAPRTALLSALAADISSQPVNVDPVEIESLAPEVQVAVFLDKLQEAGALPSGVPRKKLFTWFIGYLGRWQAMTGYTARPYDGEVTLFRAKHLPKPGAENPLTALGDAFGWDQVSTRPVNVHWIEGTHSSILDPPGVARLARILKTYLLDMPRPK